MEAVKRLSNKYQSEFDDEIDRLKQWSANFKEDINKEVLFYEQQLTDLHPFISAKKDEFMSCLLDLSPVEQLDTEKLMATFIWTGILLIATTIGGLLGGMILKPILSLVVGGFFVFLAAYFVLPSMAWHYLHKPIKHNAENDCKCRHTLVVFCLLEVCFDVCLDEMLNGINAALFRTSA
ncbi:unnamed protein product [Toxocara canis]|uniref:Aa_trans domain-containing protein n=1 Tax=Toxocara canis TaxID=6265 RepID=A0A183V7Y5_TOXCA|nr:unnamed protein product [Toxocara canis]